MFNTSLRISLLALILTTGMVTTYVQAHQKRNIDIKMSIQGSTTDLADQDVLKPFEHALANLFDAHPQIAKSISFYSHKDRQKGIFEAHYTVDAQDDAFYQKVIKVFTHFFNECKEQLDNTYSCNVSLESDEKSATFSVDINIDKPTAWQKINGFFKKCSAVCQDAFISAKNKVKEEFSN